MSRIGNKARNSNVDLIKFICAFGVICIHTQNSTFEAGLIGDFFSPLSVPFFFLIALVFFISGFKTVDLAVIANKNWRRIIVPYLFWTAIYFLLIMVKHHLTNQNSSSEWWQVLFYGSSAVQLYYIPKLLIMFGLALAVVLILEQEFKRKIIGFIVFLVSFSWLFIGVNNNYFGFGENDFAMISLYLVSAFGISKLYRRNKLSNIYRFVGFILFFLFLIIKYYGSSFISSNSFINNGVLINLVASLSLVLLAFTLPAINLPKRVEVVLGYSYGIYLSHVLFLEAYEFILKYFSFNLFYDVWTKIIFSIGVLCSSILFVFFIKKIPVLKRILVGE
jgi:surface polysaccharide O-acyltransferase-like enzyme